MTFLETEAIELDDSSNSVIPKTQEEEHNAFNFAESEVAPESVEPQHAIEQAEEQESGESQEPSSNVTVSNSFWRPDAIKIAVVKLFWF